MQTIATRVVSELERKQLELVNLHIEYMRLHNQVFRSLVHQQIPLNSALLKHNILANQWNAVSSLPRQPPDGMYS